MVPFTNCIGDSISDVCKLTIEISTGAHGYPQTHLAPTSSAWPSPSPLLSPLSPSQSEASAPPSPSVLSEQGPLLHIDHDYVMKRQQQSSESYVGLAFTFDDAIRPEETTISHHGVLTPHADALLSSCAVPGASVGFSSSLDDDGKNAGEVTDSNFLDELDDLDFSLDDIDPCSDTAMENSFQDFIDSALDNGPCPPCDAMCEDSRLHFQEDVMIVNKETFLGALNLVPTVRQRQPSDPVPQTLSSSHAIPVNNINLFSSSLPENVMDSESSSETHSSPMTPHSFSSLSSPAVSERDDQSSDRIPTKRCSCSSICDASGALYTTAQSATADAVRTCASVTAHSLNRQQNSLAAAACGGYLQNRIVENHNLLTPLSIDTSFSDLSQPFHPLSNDCLDILMDDAEARPQLTKKNTADLIKWLQEGRPEYELQEEHGSISENTEHSSMCGVEDSSVSTATSPAETLVSRDTSDPESLDLDSFIGLDAYVSEDFDLEKTVKSVHSPTDSFSRSGDETACTSQLKLSFLSGIGKSEPKSAVRRLDFTGSPNETQRFQIFSNFVKDSQMKLGFESFPPTPSPSLTASESNAMDTQNEKSQLTLLHLFSDEVAPSFLNVESAIPNIRFM